MQVTWKLPDGQSMTAEVAEGTTLMEAALANNIPGIIGECGGNMSCATCHVELSADWYDRAGTPGDFEDVMLDATEAPRTGTSRLSCQLTASEELSGIVLIVPAV